MKTPSGSTRQGFTLIEIMMAMAIFGLVMSAIYATWTAILRGSRAGLEATAQVQRERVAMHTIELALTASRSFQADVQHYGFVAENGSDAMLSFVARLPKSFPRGGRFGDFDVRRVAFSVENGPDGQRQLVLRQGPMLMEFDRDETEHPLVLAKNVKELLLEFWDARANDWTDAWAQTNQLPKMVKVTVRLSPLNPNASATKEEFVRIISLPSIAVPAAWQRPNPAAVPPPPKP
jgi:general secretion pathway protein J